MSALMAERHDLGRQESLFEGLAPPRPNPWARPPDAPANDDEPAHAVPERELADTSGEIAVGPIDDAARSSDEVTVGPSDEVTVGPSDEVVDSSAVHPPEAFGSDITIQRRAVPARHLPAQRGEAEVLAGPTLDDVVSRVWEGLATGLPAACPLCHGEVVPALGGSLSGNCTSCGMTID
jgi:hypothetical protein